MVLNTDIILTGLAIIHRHVFHILMGPKVLVRVIWLIQVYKQPFPTNRQLAHLNTLLREHVTMNHIQNVIHDLMVAMDWTNRADLDPWLPL